MTDLINLGAILSSIRSWLYRKTRYWRFQESLTDRQLIKTLDEKATLALQYLDRVSISK